MKRAALIALSGLGYFVISVFLMMPLRMLDEPIVNYNLFLAIFLVVGLAFLLWRCCTEEKQTKAYLYGFFGAIFAWQLFGELASMHVEAGLVTQFSQVDIKQLGGAFYLVGGWVMLGIFWRSQAVKPALLVFMLTFLNIWTFELYMDNYSSHVALDLMPIISYSIGGVALGLSLLFLWLARRPNQNLQTVMGCLLYISVSLALMGFSSWTKPQAFYLKHHITGLQKSISEMQVHRQALVDLRQQLVDRGEYQPEEVGLASSDLQPTHSTQPFAQEPN